MSAKLLYSDSDWDRRLEIPEKGNIPEEPYREQWRRDYSRILHSPSFRRLQGKTQLFPGNESDFFRNRLTHSLEVAQIAKSIALRLNHEDPYLLETDQEIRYDVCESAGLAHDLGHPPFGHNGEKALDEMMMHRGGFEGNAQTLRVLARCEKRQKKTVHPTGIEAGKDMRAGLNLTYRSLASILKYDREIPYSPESPRDTPIKGYYAADQDIVNDIKSHVVGSNFTGKFKTIECSIMDLADDIAYSTYDLEDALKAGFATPLSVLSISDETVELIQKHIEFEMTATEVRDILYRVFGAPLVEALDGGPQDPSTFVSRMVNAQRASENLAADGYLRTDFTSYLVSLFITSIRLKIDEHQPALSTPYLPSDIKQIVEVLKTFSYIVLISSPRLQTAELRGKAIVTDIFEAIRDSTESVQSLLPADFRRVYSEISDESKDRVICDFVAGMTDRYALEFYGRLHSESPQTIFKPI